MTYAEERRALGLCLKCPKPRMEGKSFCPKHVREIREKSKAFNAERRRLGICRWCKDPVGPRSSIFCERCRFICNERHKARDAKYREKRPCARCQRVGCHAREHGPSGTLCSRCEMPRIFVGRWKHLCKEHAASALNFTRASADVRVKKRLKKKLCYRCGVRQIAKRSTSRCQKCLDYACRFAARQRDREKKAA